MTQNPLLTRRAAVGGLASLGALALTRLGQQPGGAAPASEGGAEAVRSHVMRVGVVSAAIRGKPQPRNGHTWHFAQALHPECDLDALKRLYPYGHKLFSTVLRNPKYNLDQLPFPDIRITHYYDADPKAAEAFAEVFPGVEVATSVERMVQEVDAIWMGDASGVGDDHFDLVAPGLLKGLPTFCDKPVGGSVEGTRKILEFARKHGAPLMSGSLFRFEWGMESAIRMRDSGEHGPLEHVSARLFSRYSAEAWMIYGQHPVWSIITLMGAGVEAVSMLAHKDTCHGMITYPDRYPCHFWYGQPYERFEYNRTDVYFKKKLLSFTPSIEGDYHFGYHYEMFRMAATFRKMVLTREEPVPHQEILEVTEVVHAAAKSLAEGSRLVRLDEVSG